MLLAVDVGNTQTAIGIFDAGETLIYTGRLTTSLGQTSDELEVVVQALFALHDIDVTHINQVIIASVVPSLTEHWKRLSAALGATDICIVDSENCGGLAILLDKPSEAGADRLANAIGAVARHGAPAIVVDFGTATNIDVVNESGAYCGGVISPGLDTSADALFSHAARLSAVDLIAPAQVIGTSTRKAVQSGLMLGEAAKVDGLVARTKRELDTTKNPTVIATGGLSETLAPLCDSIEVVDTELTLYGLAEIVRRCLP